MKAGFKSALLRQRSHQSAALLTEWWVEREAARLLPLIPGPGRAS